MRRKRDAPYWSPAWLARQLAKELRSGEWDGVYDLRTQHAWMRTLEWAERREQEAR
mgnify:CR=1 FL=1